MGCKKPRRHITGRNNAKENPLWPSRWLLARHSVQALAGRNEKSRVVGPHATLRSIIANWVLLYDFDQMRSSLGKLRSSDYAPRSYGPRGGAFADIQG